jgi:hypothetical protein
MRSENNSCAVFQRIRYGRDGSANTFVAGDLLSTIGQRDIEVHPDKGAPALQVKVCNRQFGHLQSSLASAQSLVGFAARMITLASESGERALSLFFEFLISSRRA